MRARRGGGKSDLRVAGRRAPAPRSPRQTTFVNKKGPARKPAAQRLFGPVEPDFIIWPHHADEALDRIPRNETAAGIVLTFADALGVAVYAWDDRIEVAGLKGLPDKLRKPLTLYLVCLCRSIWPLLTGEAVP
jgi:hypothetical protein